MRTVTEAEEAGGPGAERSPAPISPVADASKPFSRSGGGTAGRAAPESTSDGYPEPTGYMPVRAEDDRKLWTYNVEAGLPHISSNMC